MMKIGVISDTHISDRSRDIPQEILDAFKDVDMIIHAGDLVELAVLEKLKKVCSNVKAVWGNMDPEEVKKALPEKQILKVGSHKIAVMHGYGAPNKLIDLLMSVFKNDSVDLIIFGHAHYSVNEKREGILFFNPGSATDKIFSAYNSFGIIEINDEIKARIIKL
ncbi:MAG: metallophosphoesterase [Candidatus Omnitrophica bacterium]|nr:metallophosphoesterase [Candidatus Omnitrophota bacterium]MDD5238765.1 metallophosphoesterase [Candidatus Omnitrophota bacterium]